MTTPTTPAPRSVVSFIALKRGQLVAVSIIGLILGLIGLFLPTAALLFIAIIFGIYLIFSGIFRINAALITHSLSAGVRWLSAILGVLIVVAGVMCLSDPFVSIYVLGYVIGIGWIAEGLSDVMAAIQGSVRPRWFGAISGVVSILAGIVVFILPTLGVVTFILIGSILLIVVSVSSLLTIPRAPKSE
jgi:uncharacterized membrane protein HdeD (DUF308 family)